MRACLIWLGGASSALLLHSAQAQELELVRASYGLTAVNDHGQRRTLSQPTLDLRLPFYQSAGTTLVGGFSYRGLLGAAGPTPLTNLSGGAVQLGVQQRLSTRTTLTVLATVGVYSDLRDVSGEDLRWGSGAQLLHRHSARLAYGVGLSYSRQFFGLQLVPIVPLELVLTSRLRLNGQLPFRWRLQYAFTPRLKLSLHLEAMSTSYRLSARLDSSHYVQARQWETALQLEHYVRPRWVLWLRVSALPVQEYNAYAADARAPLSIGPFALGTKRTPFTTVSSPGGAAQVGIALRITKP